MAKKYKGAKGFLLLVLLVLLPLVSIGSLCVGSTYIPVSDLYNAAMIVLKGALPGKEASTDAGYLENLRTTGSILLKLRLPRLLLGLITGAGLAIAGTVFQAVLRNPLADPYILGVSSGAALGACLGIVLDFGESIPGAMAVPLFSFTGAVLTMTVVYLIARQGTKIPRDRLLLSGVITGSFIGAVIMFILSISTTELDSIVNILMGNLQVIFTDLTFKVFLLISFLVLCCLGFTFFYAKELNAISIGEETAMGLGVDVEKTKKILFIVSSFITGAVVSWSGLIGFVGLMIPHIVRLLFGPDHRSLLPLSALCGAVFLCFADILARSIARPVEIPVGVITALFGAPFFIYLLVTRKRQIG